MNEIDYSLLRPFDPEAAKRGAAICWYADAEPLRYVGKALALQHDACVEWLDGPDKGYFETYHADKLRMAPLAWVEGKPVYTGDDLFVKEDRPYNTGFKKGAQVEVSGLYTSGNILTSSGYYLRISDLSWIPPAQEKKTIKLLAYLNKFGLFWIPESTVSENGIRVPSEDKVIEVGGETDCVPNPRACTEEKKDD